MVEVESFKKQWWINFGIIFGIIIAAGAGLYYLSVNLAAQSAKIVSDRNLVAAQTAAVGNLARLKDESTRSAPYLAAMEKLLPTHDQLFGFSQWMSTLASAHGVSASVAFSGTKVQATDASLGSDNFSLTASGSLTNLISFLADMETKSPGFLLKIDSFNVASDQSGYTLSAQGKVFSRASP